MTYGLPLPRFVYQQDVNPSMNLEVRPAFVQYTADLNSPIYTSYLQGRFDPDRPYIQMIVPNTDGMAVAEKKPIGPFGPTRPTPDIDRNENEDEKLEENKIVGCVNGSLKGTNSNGTYSVNGTNATSCYNKTLPAQAFLMLADGTTIYGVDGESVQKQHPSLDGVYELAYVAHRPQPPNSEFYPRLQYVDYNRLPWGGFGSSVLAGSPPYLTAGLYQLLYIYKPVFPVPSRSYDVYYYLPTDHEDQNDADIEDRAEENSVNMAGREGLDHDQSKAEIQENTEPTSNVDTVVEGSEERVNTQVKDMELESMVSSEKEEAKETAMPNATQGADSEEQALIDALDSKMEELQAKEEGKQIEDQDGLNAQWEDNLVQMTDKDLIDAVERVLQQLHSRLIA